jgi:DNA-binding NtrC family response regulator
VRSSSDLLAAMEQSGDAFLLCRDATTLEVVPLVEGSRVTFGRGEEADVRTESPRVSRLHARFSLEAGVLEVHDLGSRNGTRINGAMVRDARATLEAGDVVNLGPVEVIIARAAHGQRAIRVDAGAIPGAAAREEAITEGIVVADASMVKLFAVVRRLAAVTSPVLITGETGVGKEVVAEHVHKWSSRADGPFLRLNCASVPPEHLESELCGHERGAFTGAERGRIGYLESAHGGTLLLDEIDAMPLALQAKLLRVLETKAVTPVGGTREIAIDVRILCATHRELRRAVTEGRFRQDLYYRISTFTLEVPPLRERPTELLLLAELFARRFARELGRKAPLITPAARALLGSHRWPGNVRELRNVMEHSIVLHEGMTLEAEDIADLSPQKRVPLPRERPPMLRLSTPAIPPLREQMHDVEREVIRAALKAEGGNRTRAAKRLEMSRRGLIYKMIKYGLRD